MEHRERHVANVALSALHHFHIDAKRVGKLPRPQRVALFQAVDENLERRNHGGAVGSDDFALRKFFLLASFFLVR
jgi:hypothetical protein